jgi:hypothetical protein
MHWVAAEEAHLTGDAAVVTPESAWTGESNWQGAFVVAGTGGTVRFDLAGDALDAVAAGGATAHVLLHRLAEEAGTSTWTAIAADGTRTPLGTLALGGAGDPGVTEWEGLLKPYPLDGNVPSGTIAIEGAADGRMELDELMLLPAVTTAKFPTRRGGAVTLYVATRTSRLDVAPGWTGSTYGRNGRRSGPITHGRRTLEAGQFAVESR